MSTHSLNAPPKRDYRLGKRAKKQEETRQRIVEAAVDLHCSIGPARTSVSQIAERAGVQRHTYYAHFPDEWDLLTACSGLALSRDPLPSVEDWLDFPPGQERIVHGLAELYAWFGRNEGQAACVLRDAEHHEPTRKIVALRMQPTFQRAAALLAEGLPGQGASLVAVALDFHCWRILASDHSPSGAAALMAGAICSTTPVA
ncbi:TetR/AcrR family transcriptional regulator [Sphingomonas xanthus]|uniref:TetR/AcrR family transcriptional regulator n=1 Tax=Sphingomonas xanthus TaxID=2594473 RepID=A0A516ISJ9_9SPHN|nr:TetR/AcrR family transcriptional regulator [Sphingomonas xanthus]QDP19867.1 TetR/AcrR family transcriptional regulator [Sphingomonas xanthus]